MVGESLRRMAALASGGGTRAPVRQVWRDWLGLYGATFVGQLVSAVRSLLVARLLGPSQLGVWKSLQLILSYTQWTDLGAVSGMTREVPLLRGGGREEAAWAVQRAALTLTIVPSACLGISLVVAGLWADDSVVGIGLLALVPVLLSDRLLGFFFALATARSAFTLRSRTVVALALLDGVAGPIAAWLGGVVLLMLVVAATNMAVVAYLAAALPRSCGITWELREIRRLVRIGFEIAGANVMYEILRATDRLMVVAFMGTAGVGFYGLGVIVFDMVSAIPLLFGQVLLTHGAEAYGREDDPRRLFEYAEGVLRTAAWMLPLALVAAWALLPFLTAWVLPDYYPGVGAARILLWGAMFLAAHSVASVVFVTLHRLRALMLLRGGAIVFGAAFSAAVAAAGFGLVGVATVMVAVYALLSIGEFLMAGVLCGQRALSLLRSYAWIHLPGAAAAAVVLTFHALSAW